MDDLDALARAVEENLDPMVVGKSHNMKTSTIRKVVRRLRVDGKYAPSPRGGHRWSVWTEDLGADLVHLVEEYPQYTLDQFREGLENLHPNVRIPSRSAIAARLQFDLFSTKKVHVIAQERNSAEVKAERAQYATEMSHLPANVVPVFTDETGFSLGTHRTLASG
jgi:hypothetical protein